MMEVWLIKNVNEKILLPVPPSDLEMTRPMNHEDSVMTDGVERTFMSGTALRSVTINSFLPSSATYYSHNSEFVEPRYIAKQIDDWMDAYDNRISVLIIGERNIIMQSTIRNFSWTIVGGAVGQLDYSLELKEYREVGYKILQATNNNGQQSNGNIRPNNSVPKPRVYTVKRGDSLSKISISYYGNSTNWKKIYEANKSKIGKDPNYILPGMELIIP